MIRNCTYNVKQLVDLATNAERTLLGLVLLLCNASVVAESLVPGAPIIGTATGGNSQAIVTFTAPVSNGGSPITGYMVTSSPVGGMDSNAGSISLTHIIVGLKNGNAYSFTVKAMNKDGMGVASAASNSVTPAASVPGTQAIINPQGGH